MRDGRWVKRKVASVLMLPISSFNLQLDIGIGYWQHFQMVLRAWSRLRRRTRTTRMTRRTNFCLNFPWRALPQKATWYLQETSMREAHSILHQSLAYSCAKPPCIFPQSLAYSCAKPPCIFPQSLANSLREAPKHIPSWKSKVLRVIRVVHVPLATSSSCSALQQALFKPSPRCEAHLNLAELRDGWEFSRVEM